MVLCMVFQWTVVQLKKKTFLIFTSKSIQHDYRNK